MPLRLTKNAWADALGHDRRQVGRLLDALPPDGHERGRPVWALPSLLKVLDQKPSRAQHHHASRPAELDEVERLGSQLIAAIERLRAVRTVRARRALVLKGGLKIPLGPMLSRMEKLIATSTDERDKFVTQMFHDRIARDCVGELLQLLDAELAPSGALIAKATCDDEGLPPAVDDEESHDPQLRSHHGDAHVRRRTQD